MNFSAPFIRRPIATILLTLGVAMAGIAAFFLLPVSPLPQVDFPTISVSANLPGASPETMATSVAAPLERRLGLIADVSEMTSQSRTGQTQITLQFGLDRNIDGAARDVQAAINAARVDLPATLRSNPTYRKQNPADAPIIILALTSATRTPGQIYDVAVSVLQQQLLQVRGVGDVNVGGASLPAVRVELNPLALARYGIGLEDVRAALASANANRPKGVIDVGPLRYQIYSNDAATTAADYAPLVIAARNGLTVRLSDIAQVTDGVEDVHNLGLVNGKPAVVLVVTRQPGANIIGTVDRIKALMPTLQARPAGRHRHAGGGRPHHHHPRLPRRRRAHGADRGAAGGGGHRLLPAQRPRRPHPQRRRRGLPAGRVGAMYLLHFSLDNLVADGADRLDRLRRRRRHRRAREHHPPRRGGHGPARSGAARRARGRLHRAFDQRFAGGGVHSDPVDGRAGRTAVPRIRHDPDRRHSRLAGGLAEHDADDVRLSGREPADASERRRESPRSPWRWLSVLSDRAFGGMARIYERALDWSLDAGPTTIAVLLAAIALNVYLFTIVPKGFFPEQDTGQMVGGLQTDQSSSFADHRPADAAVRRHPQA